MIEPHLPDYPGGRPRKTDLRDVVDAVFYILRTGCQWRYLPKDFPPRSTAGDTSTSGGATARWTPSTTGSAARSEPPRSPTTRGPLRASTASRSTPPPAASNGAATTPRTSTAGSGTSWWTAWVYCWRCWSTAADVDDAKAASELFGRLDGQPMSQVGRMFADTKYHNFDLYEWVERHADWELRIVRRPEGEKGWVKLPIRWTVERTFAWLGQCRRLSKDREKSVLSVGVVRQAGDDPADAQPPRPKGKRRRSPTAKRPEHTYGTVSKRFSHDHSRFNSIN